MSQKSSRKSRKHADEATLKETEKTPEMDSFESEKALENGTKETEETAIEPNEQNSKESPLKDTKQNGTDVPNKDTEQKDVIETEEHKRDVIEENVDVLPESDSSETVLISDSEEQIVLHLEVEESAEETSQIETSQSKEKESENDKVSEEATTSEAKEEYLLAKDTVNGEPENGETENGASESVDNENVSTDVVVGNNTTRNIDFTLPPDSSMEQSKFLNMSKDHTFSESIKFLSSRRSIRSIKTHFPHDGINTYTLQKSESMGYKRKYCDDNEEISKRIKTDSSGLMSYLANPFVKNNVSSSTPKLTGFKSNNFDNTNVSKISLNDTEKGENKWCSIM